MSVHLSRPRPIAGLGAAAPFVVGSDVIRLLLVSVGSLPSLRRHLDLFRLRRGPSTALSSRSAPSARPRRPPRRLAISAFRA
jgi:hypothetical protein